jgi:sugar-phosphatase
VFLERHGWTVADVRIFTGRRAEDVFATQAGPWEGHDPEALAAEVRGIAHELGTPGPVPGAHDLFEAAVAAGVRLAIVTSARQAWVDLTVGEGLGVLDDVAVVVTAQDVVDGKPHPAGFLLACQRLQVDPADCVAAEDSPAGVRAAVAAGVRRVVGVTTTWPADELLDAGAERALPDLRGVVELLG